MFKNRKVKRGIAIFILAVMLIAESTIIKTNAYEEFNVNIDKEVIKVGETTNIEVQIPAYDDEIYTAELSLNAESDKDNEYLKDEYIKVDKFTYDSRSNKIKFQFTMDNKTPSAKWKITNIALKYQDGNVYNQYSYSENKYVVTTGTESTVDSAAPKIDTITTSKKRATINEVVDLIVKCKDNLSGVEGGYVKLYHEGSGQYFTYYLTKVDDTTFKASININKNTFNGEYKVYSSYIKDNYGNYLQDYYHDYSCIKEGFQVYGAFDIDDFSAPTVNSVTNTTTGIGADLGELFKVFVDARDNVSGVKSIKVGYEKKYETNGNKVVKEVTGFKYSETKGMYETDVTFTGSSCVGEWQVSYVDVEDNKGNKKRYTKEDFNYNNVSDLNITCNSTAPKFKRIYFDKTIAKPGEIVNIYAELLDDKSYVTGGTVYFYVRDDNSNEEVDCFSSQMTYDSSNKILKGSFKVDNNTPVGNLVAIISLDSSIGFKQGYIKNQCYISGTSQTVEGAFQKITSITMDKTTVKVPDRISFKAQLNEYKYGQDSNLNLTYKLKDYDIRKNITLAYDEASKEYRGTLLTNESIQSGEYILIDSCLDLENGNGGVYIPVKTNNIQSSFKITGTESLDIDPPTIENISVLNKKVKPGDKVKVQAVLKDNSRDIVTGDIFAGLNVNNVGEKNINASFVYNSTTKLYEAEFNLPNDIPNGEFIISYGRIADTKNNNNYYEVDFFKSKGATFTVTGGKDIDKTSPTINGITISNENPRVGETVKISADVKSKEIGKDVVQFFYSTPLGYKNIELKYNSTTQKYERELKVDNYYADGKWILDYISINNFHEAQWIKDYVYMERSDIGGTQLLSQCDFMVSGSQNLRDITPPTYKNMNFKAAGVRDGEKIEFELEAEDDIDEYLYGSIYYEVNGIVSYYGSDFQRQEGTNKYKGYIYVSKSDYNSLKSEIVSVIGVSLNDGMGNTVVQKNIVGKTAKVYNSYDLNMNEKYDIGDIAEIANKYNSKRDKNSYGEWENQSYDFNYDGVIDIYDIVRVAEKIE